LGGFFFFLSPPPPNPPPGLVVSTAARPLVTTFVNTLLAGWGYGSPP
jgi:hypothetical protein